MAEKVIKKVVDAVIVWERWNRIARQGEKGFYYQCEGEVKNTGLSIISNVIVIGAMYRRNARQILHFVDRRLHYQKAGGYFSIESISPGETIPFIFTISIPVSGDLIWGRKTAKNLDDLLKTGEIRRKAFLVYDTRHMDEHSKEWFKYETPSRLVFTEKEWKLNYDEEKDLYRVRSWGKLKNVGQRHVDMVQLVAEIDDFRTREPIWWPDPRREQETAIPGKSAKRRFEAKFTGLIEDLKPAAEKTYDFAFDLPAASMMEFGKWKFDDIKKGLQEGFLQYNISLEIREEGSTENIYRDLSANPTLIQEKKDELKADLIDSAWRLEEEERRYAASGTVRNTGESGIQNLYIIASILDRENEQPIFWEEGPDVRKSMQIERIAYLEKGTERPFNLILQLPSGGRTNSEKFPNSDSIIKGVADGLLKQQIDFYFKQDDVRDEAVKRINLGNAYFRMGNYKVGIKEFYEAVHLLPEDHRAYMNLALIYYKESKFHDALRILDQLAKIKLEYGKAFYLYGLVYIKLERWDDAERSFKLCLNADVKNSRAMYNLACVYLHGNRVSEGLDWLKSALQIDRQSIMTHLIRDPELDSIRRNPRFLELLQSQV